MTAKAAPTVGRPERDNTTPFRHASELIRLLDRFERGTLPVSQWNHRAHLAVAAWYLITFDETEATDRMISGIRRYNRVHGIRMTRSGGYHETLTLFWLAITRDFLTRCPRGSRLTRVNGFIQEYGNRGELHLEYYTRERVMSWKARNRWIAPDLAPLPKA